MSDPPSITRAEIVLVGERDRIKRTVGVQRWREKAVSRTILGSGPLSIDAARRAVHLKDRAVVCDRVPAKVFDQNDGGNLAVVTTTPHFCTT